MSGDKHRYLDMTEWLSDVENCLDNDANLGDDERMAMDTVSRCFDIIHDVTEPLVEKKRGSLLMATNVDTHVLGMVGGDPDELESTIGTLLKGLREGEERRRYAIALFCGALKACPELFDRVKSYFAKK